MCLERREQVSEVAMLMAAWLSTKIGVGPGRGEPMMSDAILRMWESSRAVSDRA